MDNKLDEEKFKEAMTSVLTSLLARANKERAETEPYKELFAASEKGLEPFCRELERKFRSVVLDASQVLESKGFEVTNEVWDFLAAIPIISRRLEREISNQEGICCCVDKTFHIIYLHLLDLLTKDDKELGE
jgi:hypothetical protein